jgi:hypothetical protein
VGYCPGASTFSDAVQFIQNKLVIPSIAEVVVGAEGDNETNSGVDSADTSLIA